MCCEDRIRWLWPRVNTVSVKTLCSHFPMVPLQYALLSSISLATLGFFMFLQQTRFDPGNYLQSLSTLTGSLPLAGFPSFKSWCTYKLLSHFSTSSLKCKVHILSCFLTLPQLMLHRPSIIHCVVIVWSVVWTPLCRFTAQYSTWPGSYLLNERVQGGNPAD